MSTSDPVGTALAAIGAGATTGAVILTGAVLALRILQDQPIGAAEETGAALLTGSMAASLVVAAATGWRLTRVINDFWRRGVTAAVSVLGMVLLGVAATAVDQLAGAWGLGLYLVGLLGAVVITHRLAARNAAR